MRTLCVTSAPGYARVTKLAAAGLSLMVQAEAAVGGQLRRRADLYCDGLMLALCPNRLTNFTGIRLGQHLQRVGSGWTICFAAEETKSRVPLELPFPEELVGNLERYLANWRRILLDTTGSDQLWISSQSSLVLVPQDGKLAIEVRGDLAAMSALGQAQTTRRERRVDADLLVQVNLVAGARNTLHLLVRSACMAR